MRSTPLTVDSIFVLAYTYNYFWQETNTIALLASQCCADGQEFTTSFHVILNLLNAHTGTTVCYMLLFLLLLLLLPFLLSPLLCLLSLVLSSFSRNHRSFTSTHIHKHSDTQSKPEQSTEGDVLVCKYKTPTSCLVLVGFIMAGGGGKPNRTPRACHNPVITHSPSTYLFLAQSEMEKRLISFHKALT